MYKSFFIVLLLAAGTAAAALHLQSSRNDPEPRDRTVLAPIKDRQPAAATVVAAAGAPRIEAVFVLDTTGSMSGMLDAAKRRIWDIATALAQADPAPELHLGLVAYRDRGDAYVTRRVDLSQDLDAVYAELVQLVAGGGGDGPESVNQALHEAVHAMHWSEGSGAYRTIFLVGDAPPHMDYAQDVPWQTTLREAARRGIVVNSLLCGENASARTAWQAIAAASQGRFLAVDSSGGAVDISSPYDEELAALAEELDATRLWYGRAEERARAQKRADREADLLAAVPATARAARSSYKATRAGTESMSARSDLVSEAEAGTLSLDSMAEGDLPETLQALAPEAREEAIGALTAKRRTVRSRIAGLAEQRAEWLAEKKAALDRPESTLDRQLLDTIAVQAADKGLRLESTGGETRAPGAAEEH